MGCGKITSDCEGSVGSLITTTYDAAGNVVSTVYEYDAVDVASILNFPAVEDAVREFTWHFDPTKDVDVQEGLYDVKTRCFDPVVGRWLSQDPMGFEAGDSNLFRYPYQE